MPYTLGPRVEFEALPTADYKLTLKSWKEVVEDKDTKYSKKGDLRNEMTWVVTVPGGEDQERRDWPNVPATFSEKSTFVHIALALRLVDEASAIENGATIDWDQGIGKSCMGTIVKALKADGKTWGDKIAQYAPLPAEAAPVKSKTDMATKLRSRLITLLEFAGLSDTVLDSRDQKSLTDALKTFGAKEITDKALDKLTETIQGANMLGINDYDELKPGTLSLKDALVLYETITARLDA